MSRLKSAHDLSGLMKYADRAPWDEALTEMLSAHLGPACEATGLDPDAIFAIIGDHWQGPLWGCAFEDLLTQELEPDGRNLVDDYLKRRGWNEKAPDKAYMRALRDTVMSLYEVSEVVPGQSMTLRDLLRDIAPVTVREHGATRTLVNWDRIAARVIAVNGHHGISGAVELGLQFQQPVGDWILGASGDYAFGRAAALTTRANLDSWSIGTEARRGPLRIGGAFVHRGDSNRLFGIGAFYSLIPNIQLRADIIQFREKRAGRQAEKGAVGMLELQFTI